jgi:hypothetical protein
MADPTETRLRKPVPDAASANGRRGDVDDQEALIRHISGGAMQTQHVFVVIIRFCRMTGFKPASTRCRFRNRSSWADAG